MDILHICRNLRSGADELAQRTALQKNNALRSVAAAIHENRQRILDANAQDIDNARENGMTDALIERLMLDSDRIDTIIAGMNTVIDQADPVGEITSGWTTPKGLEIRQIRVPLGVVAIIYESRPNVTVDAFCLAYKSGNAILLRGSSSALASNKALVYAIKEGLSAAAGGVPSAIELSDSTDHTDIDSILTAKGLIDVVLPRGGAKLIQTVTEKARIPVIETGSGVCHLYEDESGDPEMAALIAENAKIQRPGACNAIETILVHKNAAKDFLPLLAIHFKGRVQIRADMPCFEELASCPEATGCRRDGSRILVHAEDSDFGHEFLDYTVAVTCVDSIEDAVSFINNHNTKHSETIITQNRDHARFFQQKVDAACVYVNASTRFTDGGEFGFGAELGISTQKLHARGPMGIKALTTTKFLIDGEGQIR